MITSVRKPFWDYQKEEDWINAKAAQGKALIKYTWCHYLFEDSAPGEYIYRIELLDRATNNTDYLSFLKENGIECVSTYMRWVYLRKKAADGPFQLYSDKDSRLASLRQVSTMWLTLAICILAIVLSQVAIMINSILSSHSHIWIVSAVSTAVCLAISIVFFNLWSRVHRVEAKLKRERVVTE